jgi:cellulose 1,4-beta-cellobiosidase
MGNTAFYGPGLTVNTNQKITVVTQFVGSPITSIKRFYVQNGKVVPNSNSTVSGKFPHVRGEKKLKKGGKTQA